MDLIISILKVFVYMYIPIRVIANKEPTKTFFERIDFRANRFLHSLKDEQTQNILIYIRNSLFKINVFIIAISALMLFVFPSSSYKLLAFLAPMFVILTTVIFCISWNMNHRQTVKDFFVNSPLMLLPIAPLALAAIETWLEIPVLTSNQSINQYLEAMNYSVWEFCTIAALISFFGYIVFPYILFWLVLAPLFYLFMILIYGVQYSLRLLDKFVTQNLMDCTVFILGALVAFFF